MTNFSSASDDVAMADVFSPDSSKLYVTGTGAGGMLTRAYDASTGSVLWSQDYTYGTNEGKAIAVSPDGTKVYVTGQSLVGGHYDYVTIAYSAATGTRLWFQRFDSTSHLDDIPAALAVSPDGSKVFVTGSSVGSSTGQDYATVAYDASTGSRLWVMRLNWASLDDAATAIGVSPDGSKVFVTGSILWSSLAGSDYATIAYDASSGARLWLTLFNGPLSNSIDNASALVVSPDGTKVYVSGLSEYNNSQGDGGDYSATTVAYAATGGTQLWSKPLRGSPQAGAFPPSLSISSDGTRVYLATSVGYTNNTSYFTAALTAPHGTVVWNQYYDYPTRTNTARTARALAVTPDGEVFVTGSSGGPTGQDVATVGFDSTGHFLWSGDNAKRYNGPANGDDSGNAIAVSPDSSKFAVVGSSAGSGTGLDWVAIMYSTS